MNFHIETYHPNLIEGMAALYNAETAQEPHIAPLTPELFAKLVARKAAFDPNGVFVGVAGGQVIGWSHACVAVGTEAHQELGQPVGRIRMLLYPREHLELGSALVSEATRWLRGFALETVEAMGAEWGYPFYRGLWMGGEPMCPTTLPHVHLALGAGGYKTRLESIFMSAPLNASPPELSTALPVEYVKTEAVMWHEAMRESWQGFAPRQTRAFVAGKEAGSIGWTVLSHVAARLGAPCLNIWQLSVAETHRRKGIAGALVSRALRQGYAEGARHASVATQLWNTPAHRTYATQGFSPHRLLIGRVLP